MPIEFRDLKRQYKNIKIAVDEQINTVISSAHFISGPQVWELEQTLADYVGRRHCITCANGTDAISIALQAVGVGCGDAVFVPDFTFFSSGECPAVVGATPVFVDVSPVTYNIDPVALQSAVQIVLSEGRLNPKAVVAVDLFGQPFDYPSIRFICDRYGMLLLEDAAQGFGGSYKDGGGNVHMACSFGDISTTSFFPAKPLGCYGDGGAIFTDDDNLSTICRSIAVHGKDMTHPDDPNAKYSNVRLGMNSRLDTIQAGLLLVKFRIFHEELVAINHVAELYSFLLRDINGLVVPVVADQYYSSWAQYAIQLPNGTNRNKLQQKLESFGIPTNIYYIKPMHKQGAFKGTRSAEASCPVTENLCDRVLCLPIHPYLEDDEVVFISDKLKETLTIVGKT